LILETIALKRESTLTVDDTILLILSVAVSIENFTVEGLIEEAYKFIYKSLIEAENYLGSDNTKSLLIDYVTLITSKRKDKNKLPLVSSSLIVPEGSKDSVSSLLSQYNTQIISSLESQPTLLPIYNINNNNSTFQQLLPVWGYINYEFTQSFFIDSMSSAFGIGQN